MVGIGGVGIGGVGIGWIGRGRADTDWAGTGWEGCQVSCGAVPGAADFAGGSNSRNNCVTELRVCGTSFGGRSVVGALLSGVDTRVAVVSWVSRGRALYCCTQARSAVSSGNF